MERLLPTNDLPFQVGALYNRQREIHGVLGGQGQGGISTPASQPFVILFTGEAGKQHGYHDFWDEKGVFHYYGEGQSGDMQDVRGNRAIHEHMKNNKRLLLFQMMGHGRPYRYLGEFRFLISYIQSGVPDTSGNLRNAIVFKLEPLEQSLDPLQDSLTDSGLLVAENTVTTSTQVVEVRTKQALFKRRLLTKEKQCRLTGIDDLRFLRASHIKPWAKCASGDERIDGCNGLLLSPHADFLFDQGWITFEDDGRLVRSGQLPSQVIDRIGLNLQQGRRCGDFLDEQKKYLEYHRNAIFERNFSKDIESTLPLITTGGESVKSRP